MHFCIVLLALLANLADCDWLKPYGEKIGCGRINRDFGNFRYDLKHPFTFGGSVTLNGTVDEKVGDNAKIRVDIYLEAPENQRSVGLHIGQYIFADVTQTIYNTNIRGHADAWLAEIIRAPPLFPQGRPFEVTVKYTENGFEVYSGEEFVFTYPLRTPKDKKVTGVSIQGPQTLWWMHIGCN